MPRQLPQARAIRDIADSQHGLITARQLAELGVHRSTTQRRTLGYMWTRVVDGIHLVDGGSPTPLQREAGALLYGGPGSIASGTTALRHHGVRALRLQERRVEHPHVPEPAHVLIPHERRRKSAGYIRIERTRRMPDAPVMRHGLTLAPVARAVADAARRLRSANDVNALVAEVVQREMCTIEELEVELRDGSRRGSALFRDALASVAIGARSGPEVDLVSLLTQARLPHVQFNVRIVDSAGEFIAIPDAWLDDVGLAVEVDSRQFHAEGDAFARTVRRNARYARAGVPAYSVMPEDLARRPTWVLNQISAARDTAASRPRPNVRAVVEEHRAAGREAWRWGA